MREVRQQICATHEFQTATFRFLLNLYIGGGHLGGQMNYSLWFILWPSIFRPKHFRNAKTIHTPVRGRSFIDRKLVRTYNLCPLRVEDYLLIYLFSSY